MVDSKEESIVFDDETKENETSIYYPQYSTEGKEIVKSLSPDENNPLGIPEESATTAVFYPQYNEATIEKSEDTVSEPIQDSDFNNPSHMSNTIFPDEGRCNADTCIEKNISANRKENGKEVLSEPHGCLDGNKESDDISSCRSIHVPETLFENVPQQHTLPQLISSGSEMCIGLQETTNITSDQTEDYLEKEEIFCNPCLHGDLKTKATIFCKTCDVPEPLCADCAVQHTRHKLCRNHELCDNIVEFSITRIPFKPKENEVRFFCDSCVLENIKTTATHFCKTCEDPEPLCNKCAQQHIRHKLCRNHEICDVIEELHDRKAALKLKENQYKQLEVMCESCLFGNLNTRATHFCKTCEDPEPLCNSCAQQHIRHKLCRDHEICDVIEELLDKKVALNQKETQYKETEVFCEPCRFGDLNTKATHFCKTCEDQEPLCDNCAQQHIRHKLCRSHEICDVIEELLDIKEALNKKENQCKKNEVLCKPCRFGDLNTKATHFCKTCEDLEPLCDNCAQQHIRHKSCRDHEICDVIEELFDMKILNQKNTADNLKTLDDKCPGKPNATEIQSDFVRLFWNKSGKQADHYQIRYKTKDENLKWKFTETDSGENNMTITGLMAYTKYVFQVRGIFGDQEGPYGPVSEDIETTKSLATTLLDFSVLQSKTICPPVYLLPVQENANARNTTARTRMLTLGEPTVDYCDEKTIMLVGATGSGKSTLVDGIVNYIMGVSFDDPFRFSIITLEEEEKKAHNQAISQTEWITVYKIYPKEGSRLNCTLNIIDTPGFGDTRGIERDNAIVDQIRHLFSAQGEQGVLYIDAVCFIVKAPDARLTVVQRYIFSSIMSLFGKNIESNICTLITFADGAKAPVLASLIESKLPFGLTFNFNNSALFAENRNRIHNTLSPMFWEMGCSSFERFFNHIRELETKSLCQTKDVLEEREQLKTVISNIRPQISAGLSKLSELQQQLDIFKRYKNEIKDNQNFEYKVEETRQEMIDLPRGQHVTNCMQCNITCHADCRIADDERKRKCKAIDKLTGLCKICAGKCIWSDHKNTPYIFKYVTETVTKTYAEMKKSSSRTYANA